VNDYLNRLVDLTNNADSKSIASSFWVRRNSLSANVKAFQVFDKQFVAEFLADDTFQIQGEKADDTVILKVASSAISDNQWHHIMFSFDMNNTANRHLYVDDISDLATITTYTNDVLDFTRPGYGVGAAPNGTFLLDGDLADLWVDHGTYIDMSVTNNRRKFISANGMPMYLGPDGSIPTGSPPDIFLTGDAITWHSNRGTGGSFTEGGEITYSSSQPGDAIIDASVIDLTNGLAAYWAFDETGNTSTAADSSGNGNNGTLTNFPADPSANWVGGRYGNALDFDGVNDLVNVGTISNVNFSQSYTISTWVNMDIIGDPDSPCSSPTGPAAIFDKIDGNPAWKYHQLSVGSWRGSFTITHEESAASVNKEASSTNQELIPGRWYHVLAVYDSTAQLLKIYVNGALQQQTAIPNALVNNSTIAAKIGGSYTGCSPGYLDGRIDDFRIYSRVLNNAEIQALAENSPGKIIYDQSRHMMIYFNGAENVAMGPPLGTPPDISVYLPLDETSGSAINSTTGGGTTPASGTWVDGVNNSVAEETTTGTVGNGITFDGVDDYIDMTGLGWSIRGYEKGSISVWFKTASGDGTIFGQDEFGNNSTDGSKIWLETGDVCAKRCSSSVICTTGGGYDDNAWHHAVINGDPDLVALYVDNTLVSQVADTNCWNDGGGDVYIGRDYEADYLDGRDFFGGTLDELRIYLRNLSEYEIGQLYNFGLSGGAAVGTSCTSPSKPEGTIIYNNDYNLLQYCNGENWIGIGK
jgi:hypothetical protein